MQQICNWTFVTIIVVVLVIIKLRQSEEPFQKLLRNGRHYEMFISIRNSKYLHKTKSIINKSDLEITDFQELFKLQDQLSPNKFNCFLQQLNSFNHFKLSITLSKDSPPQEQEVQLHLKLIWAALLPGQPFSRRSPLWIQIGFQVEDPVSDLRAVGIVGLKLFSLYVTQRKKQSLQNYLFSTKETGYKFFAVTFLHFVNKLLLSLQKQKFEKVLFKVKDEERHALMLQKISQMFIGFHKVWKAKGKSFMDHNSLIVPFLQQFQF